MNNIKEYRKMLNLTQGQLSYRLGVSKNTISSWENGFFNPDLDNIKKLLYIFRCSFEDLFIDLKGSQGKIV